MKHKISHFAQLLAVASFLAIYPGISQASPIAYDLIGVTTQSGALTGTVSIDSVTDRVTSAYITFNDSFVGNLVFTNIGSPNSYNGIGQDYISGPSNSPLNYGGQIALYYDTANIGATGNLDICLAIGPCGTGWNQASYVQAYVSNGLGGPFAITGGSLDLSVPSGSSGTAVTPEPPSLFLLGTGLLVTAGITSILNGRASKLDVRPIPEPEA